MRRTYIRPRSGKTNKMEDQSCNYEKEQLGNRLRLPPRSDPHLALRRDYGKSIIHLYDINAAHSQSGMC